MSLRFLLHILFLRKWYILVALIGAPLAAGAFLLFAEPIYESHCKLVIHDRNNETDPLRERRPTLKDDTYIQTQIELIKTDLVTGKVVDRAGLIPIPPSQAPYVKVLGFSPPPSHLTPEELRIAAIREMKKRITADAVNPMVLSISSQMNTPELARKVTQCVYEVYKEEFERMQRDTGDLLGVFQRQLDGLQKNIDETNEQLQKFYTTNVPTAANGLPQIVVPPKNQDTISPPANAKGSTEKNPAGDKFTGNPESMSPLAKLRGDILNLDMALIKIAATENKDSFAYRSTAAQLSANRKLLEEEESKISQQISAADRERALIWRRETFRAAFTGVLSEYTKAQQSVDIKNQIKNAVTAQEEATFDPQPIFPKRTLIMLASAFIGLVLGLGLAYLAHVLDSTYHLPEDFASDTGIPVLAAIPLADSRTLAEGY